MQLEAVKRVRHAMNQHGIDAFITLSGPGTILWIPFADAPTYPDFRTWAHRLFAELPLCSPKTPRCYQLTSTSVPSVRNIRVRAKRFATRSCISRTRALQKPSGLTITETRS